MVGASITPSYAEETVDDSEKNYLIVFNEDISSATYSTVPDEEASFGNRNLLVLSMTAEEAAELSLDDRVVSIEEDIIVTAMSENENMTSIISENDISQDNYEWNLVAIHATPEDLAAYPTDESVVKVALLDSGTGVCEDLDVIEYINLVPEEQDIITYDEDGTGHGTAVAGILEANDDNEGIIGVAPDVSLYSVKVFDYSNTAPISRIVEGIYWAIDHDINIINMSFGTDVNSYALHQAIQAADAAGILMVAAAGNNTMVEYPAAYPEVIAVGATDYEGNRADFSATGETLELMAPGVCVLTDSFYGGIMALNGTSLAAPHVAGAAAVLWAKDMSKSSDFIRQLMNASANRSLGAANEYGNGLLDVKHAFEIYDEFEASYVPGVYTYDEINENMQEYVIGDNPGYVVGSWGSSIHNATIDQGNGYYFDDNLQYMKNVSLFLDQNTNFTCDDKTACFHGGRNYGSKSARKTSNYVNDLVFMYKLAIALKGMEGASLDTQKAKVDDVIQHMGNTAEYDTNFINKVKDLLGTTITGSSMDNQTSASVNAYKILGAVMHMAGDTYAHRSMVPRNSVNTTVSENKDNAITGNYYNLNHFNHFNNNESVCSLALIEEKAYNGITEDDDYEYNSATMCNHRNWECFQYGVANGLMEFKDIRRWTLITVKSTKYEDNSNFYRSRYSIGTNYTTQIILNSFVNNTALDEKLFLPGVNGHPSYAIRLNSLRKLYLEAGFAWEPNAGDDWSAYTTSIVR